MTCRFHCRLGRGAGLALLLSGVVLISSGSAVDAADLVKANDWVRTDSHHFTVFTNAGPRKAERLAEELERLRGVMHFVSPTLGEGSGRPNRVYLFEDFRQFERFFPGAFDHNFVAYSQSRERANYLAITLRQGMETYPVTYKQYARTLLSEELPELPLWLQTGLAEFFSYFRTSGDRIEVGHVSDWNLKVIRGRALMPLSQLTAMRQSDPVYRRDQPRVVFDSESWALVHYLLTENPGRRDQLLQFITRLHHGQETGAAFRDAFGTGPEGLEGEFYAYIRDPRFHFLILHRGLEAEKDEEIEKPQRMSEAEALFRLGDLLIAFGGDRSTEAETYFARASQVGADSPWADIGRGYAYLQEQNWAEAVDSFQRAARSNPEEFEAQFGLGVSLLELVGDPHAWFDDLDAETQKRILSARSAFQNCVELRPKSGDAWARLGSTWSWDPQPAEGAQALEHAFRALPGRRDVGMRLLRYYARLGAVQDAQRVAQQGLRPIATPQLWGEAQKVLQEAAARASERQKNN